MGACSKYGEDESSFWVWCVNLREIGHLGRPRRGYEFIKMGLQELGCGLMDWVELVQDRDS